MGNNVIYEKKKIFVRKIVHACLILLFFFGIGIVACSDSSTKRLKPEEYDLFVEQYDINTNQTDCRIQLTFDQDVKSGYANVSFYDEDDKFLGKVRIYTTRTDSTALSNTLSGVCTIKGNPDSCKFEFFESEKSNDADKVVVQVLYAYMWYLLLVLSPIWIRTFTESCKEYSYKGQQILVYCGRFHYYIKVNGVKYDEAVLVMAFHTTRLSCTLDSGDEIFVTITPVMQCIRLKINQKLYAPNPSGRWFAERDEPYIPTSEEKYDEPVPQNQVDTSAIGGQS